MRKLAWTLVAASAAANVYLFAKLLDAGIMLDNSRSETKRLRERSDLSLRAIQQTWVGKKPEDVAELSRRLENETVIVGVKGSAFEIGDLVFETKNGVVSDIHYFD